MYVIYTLEQKKTSKSKRISVMYKTRKQYVITAIRYKTMNGTNNDAALCVPLWPTFLYISLFSCLIFTASCMEGLCQMPVSTFAHIT